MLAIDSDGFLFRLYERPAFILCTVIRGIPTLARDVVLTTTNDPLYRSNVSLVNSGPLFVYSIYFIPWAFTAASHTLQHLARAVEPSDKYLSTTILYGL